MPEFTLLNTRPAEQAQALTRLVESAGGEALACPTIEIDFLPLDAVAQARLRDLLAACDKAVFVSANAVEGLIRQKPCWPERLPQWYAIGQATLAFGALHDLPMHTVEGVRFDSEALLERADLQQLDGQCVLLVKGEGGRDKLEQTLRARGAQVRSLVLYRRVAKPLCEQAWRQFRQSRQPIVLASSLTGLEYLLAALEEAKPHSMKNDQAWSEWLQQQPLVAFSERIASWALGRGWQGPIEVVDTHSDPGIMACIERLLRSH
jgi:uroporphyrinogen-III synthase